MNEVIMRCSLVMGHLGAAGLLADRSEISKPANSYSRC